MTPRDAPRSGPPARRGRQRTAFAQSCSAANRVLECGLVANRIEVRVLLRHVPAALPHLDRPPKVPDGLVGLTREALAARHVVVEVRLVGALLDELPAPQRRVRVPAGLVER